MSATTEPKGGRLKRLAWFAALWLGGVLVVGALAYGLRFLLGLG
jgi:hypothetical protein